MIRMSIPSLEKVIGIEREQYVKGKLREKKILKSPLTEKTRRNQIKTITIGWSWLMITGLYGPQEPCVNSSCVGEQ